MSALAIGANSSQSEETVAPVNTTLPNVTSRPLNNSEPSTSVITVLYLTVTLLWFSTTISNVNTSPGTILSITTSFSSIVIDVSGRTSPSVEYKSSFVA